MFLLLLKHFLLLVSVIQNNNCGIIVFAGPGQFGTVRLSFNVDTLPSNFDTEQWQAELKNAIIDYLRKVSGRGLPGWVRKVSGRGLPARVRKVSGRGLPARVRKVSGRGLPARVRKVSGRGLPARVRKVSGRGKPARVLSTRRTQRFCLCILCDSWHYCATMVASEATRKCRRSYSCVVKAAFLNPCLSPRYQKYGLELWQLEVSIVKVAEDLRPTKRQAVEGYLLVDFNVLPKSLEPTEINSTMRVSGQLLCVCSTLGSWVLLTCVPGCHGNCRHVQQQ